MGRRAPVGSLLWTTRVDFDSLRVGDFITFHPPGQPSVTYSHLVYQRNPDGTLTTKGMLSGPDPWTLTAQDVVGIVRMTWPGAGWLVVAAPILIIGFLITGVVYVVVGARWKLPLAIVLIAVTLSIAIVVHRPFLNAERIAVKLHRGGGADVTFVGTGLLPIRIESEPGRYLDLDTGQVGTVHVPSAGADNRLRVHLGPAVPFWFWPALILFCFLPAIYSAVIGLSPPAAGRTPAKNPSTDP